MSIRDKLISGPLGFGSARLGSMFRNIPAEEAAATGDAAWQQGIRYFDTEPLYGVGLSKMRPGREDLSVTDSPNLLKPAKKADDVTAEPAGD